MDKEYSIILEQLSYEEFDLVTLTKKYQQIKMIDYFQSKLGIEAFNKLQEARGGRM